MTECAVTCSVCRTDTGRTKVWRWLCEECAEECAEQHRRDTGHPVELRVTKEPTIETVRESCRAAAMLKRRRWP